MLDTEEDEENARTDEEADDAATVPGVDGATEVDRHDAGDEGTGNEKGSHIVDFRDAIFDGNTRTRIKARQEENPNTSKGSSDAKVDV